MLGAGVGVVEGCEVGRRVGSEVVGAGVVGAGEGTEVDGATVGSILQSPHFMPH